MNDLYLRVEAVNLGNTVYDTNDISTIRGGSAMLLEAVKSLESLTPNIEPISIGASAGLFRVKNQDANAAKQKVLDHLRKKTGGHATFLADTLEGTEKDYKKINETLMAKNRWAQWKQLTVPWDGQWKGSDKPCHFDGVRPAACPVKTGDGDKMASTAVEFRRENGRNLRKRIYSAILGYPISLSFTHDIETLSHEPSQGILNGKIAFIYIDGNKFGKIRDQNCQSFDDIKTFDQAVQKDFRKSVLQKILDHMQADSASQNGGKLRIETLLWGGDEIEWVVPAWKGWEILKLFYGHHPAPQFKDTPLTHAAGVVFCHHNAPILQIRKLAHSLAEKAKEQLHRLPSSHAEGDIFHYLVLESFDMLEGSLSHFLKDYYKPSDYADHLMKAADLEIFQTNLKILRRLFPRNKVYAVIKALKEGNPIDAIVERGMPDCPQSQQKDLQDAITQLTGANPHRWFTIADLWDYVVDPKPSSQGGA